MFCFLYYWFWLSFSYVLFGDGLHGLVPKPKKIAVMQNSRYLTLTYPWDTPAVPIVEGN